MPLTTDLILDRLKRRFRDPSNQIVTEADWVLYLEDAMHWLQSHGGGRAWPWMEKTGTVTVLATTNTIALPTGLSVIKRAHNDTDDYPMTALQGSHGVSDRWPSNDPAATGTPLEYRIYQYLLQVYPTPTQDTIITLDWIGEITHLDPDLGSEPVDTADVDFADINMPESLSLILIEYSLFLAYMDDENKEAAGAHQSVADSLLPGVMQTYLGGQTAEYGQIVDRFFDS